MSDAELFFDLVLTLLVFGLVFVLYLLPMLIAGIRNHRNLTAICLLNVLMGWTLIGWVAALIWSVHREK